MSVESSEWKSWRLRRRTCTQTLGSALAARGFPSRYLRRKSPISVSSNGASSSATPYRAHSVGKVKAKLMASRVSVASPVPRLNCASQAAAHSGIGRSAWWISRKGV